MNFLSEIDDRKESEEEKIFFKTNVLVPKTNSMRKEEGATVDFRPFCHLPSLNSWLVHQAGRAAFSMETTLQEAPIKYR